MDPRDTVGRIYKEDHYTSNIATCSVPCGFGEQDFFYVCLLELMTPGMGPFLTPGA